MQGPGIECGLSIGFDAFLLSFSTNRMLLFTVSLCLCPPGQNSGISNTAALCLPYRPKIGRIGAQHLICKHPFLTPSGHIFLCGSSSLRLLPNLIRLLEAIQPAGLRPS